VNSITARRVDWLRQERAGKLDRIGVKTSPPPASALGRTAALLVSLGLWWGIWSATSSVALFDLSRGASSSVVGSFEPRLIVRALRRCKNTCDQHRQYAG
jgi:hypothetical protein